MPGWSADVTYSGTSSISRAFLISQGTLVWWPRGRPTFHSNHLYGHLLCPSSQKWNLKICPTNGLQNESEWALTTPPRARPTPGDGDTCSRYVYILGWSRQNFYKKKYRNKISGLQSRVRAMKRTSGPSEENWWRGSALSRRSPWASDNIQAETKGKRGRPRTETGGAWTCRVTTTGQSLVEPARGRARLSSAEPALGKTCFNY